MSLLTFQLSNTPVVWSPLVLTFALSAFQLFKTFSPLVLTFLLCVSNTARGDRCPQHRIGGRQGRGRNRRQPHLPAYPGDGPRQERDGTAAQDPRRDGTFEDTCIKWVEEVEGRGKWYSDRRINGSMHTQCPLEPFPW